MPLPIATVARFLPALIGLLAWAFFTGAAAQTRGERQSLAAVSQAVEDHVSRETRGLPGTVSYTVGSIDPRLSLAACPALQTSTAPGTRLWGKASVVVRCGAPTWQIYVPVAIRVVDNFVVTSRPIAQGQTLGAADMVLQRGDLAALPAGVFTATEAAIGQTAAVSVSAGQALRQDMLRAPLLIQQGQTVRVVARGKSFEVSTDGRALTNAHADQVVDVRLASGQLVNGVARPGPVVEAVSLR